MANYKIPIIEKLYEAYSAIADGRIRFGDEKIEVDSSDYAKTYTITKADGTYISNDNMSYWKATIGYPILAVMMLQGELEFNNDIIPHFKNINWKKLNTEHKNDYVKVAGIILNEMQSKGIDTKQIRTETEKTYEKVKALSLPYVKSKLFPPK